MIRGNKLFSMAAIILSITVGVFLFSIGTVKSAPYFGLPTISATITSSTSVRINVSNIDANTEYMYLYKNNVYYSSIWSSVTVSGLPCGTHSFKVFAEDVYGTTGYSNTVYATPATCPTMTGPSLSGSAGSTTSINLAWNDPNTNEEGYRVYNPPYNTPSATLAANSTSYTVSGLLCGTSYSYYVQAYNTTTGQSGTSNTVTTSTSACPVNSPPNAAPSNVTMNNITTTSVGLAWNDNATNEDGYYVWRTGSSAKISLAAGSTSYTYSGLTCGSFYTFYVSAYKQYLANPVSYQNNFWYKTLSWLGLGNIAQAATEYIYVETSAASVSGYTASCDQDPPYISSWSPNPYTTGNSMTVSISYADNVAVSQVLGCASQYGSICTPSTTVANPWSFTSTGADTTTCTKAKDLGGVWSSTECKHYYLAPPAPYGLSTTNLSQGAIKIDWTSDATAYPLNFDIYRSGIHIGSVSRPNTSTFYYSFTDAGCPAAGNYTYTIKASVPAHGYTSSATSNSIYKLSCDTTAPTGSVSIKSGWDTTPTTSNSVSIGCADSGSGCRDYKVYANDSTCSSTEVASGTGTSGSATVTLNSGDGPKYVSARLWDNSNNTTCVSDTIFLDTTPPVVTASINNGAASTSSQNVTLNMNCSDNSYSGGGVAYLPFGKTYALAGQLLSWLGLISEARAAAAPPNGIVGCQQYKVFTNSSCSGTAVASNYGALDGASSVSLTLPGTGTQYASVEYMDGAGNSSCASDSITVGSAPTACSSVTVTNANSDADAGYTKVSPMTFQCNGSTGATYYNHYIYFNGGYKYSSTSGITNSVTASYGTGTYAEAVAACNTLGCSATVSGSIIYMDWSNTSVSATPSTTVWTNQNVDVSLNAGTAIKDARYSIGTNSLNASCTSGGSLYYSGGNRVVWALTFSANNTLYLCGRDRAGNTATASLNVSNIDKVAPVLSSTATTWACSQSKTDPLADVSGSSCVKASSGALNKYSGGKNSTSTNANDPAFQISIPIVESGSGIKEARCNVIDRGTEVQTDVLCLSGGNVFKDYSRSQGDNNGEYEIRVTKLIDNAGNESTPPDASYKFNVQNSSPTIVIP